MTTNPKLTDTALRQFTGSENWYRHALNRNVLFTDGAKHVADAGGAYWLLDTIALAQCSDKRVAAEAFQVWKLVVRADCSATITCEDGDGEVVSKQELEFTDFPAPEITLWFENSTIYLPSER